eukprot:6186956-Pleurochrysis_carterae.AAC.1
MATTIIYTASRIVRNKPLIEVMLMRFEKVNLYYAHLHSQIYLHATTSQQTTYLAPRECSPGTRLALVSGQICADDPADDAHVKKRDTSMKNTIRSRLFDMQTPQLAKPTYCMPAR